MRKVEAVGMWKEWTYAERGREAVMWGMWEGNIKKDQGRGEGERGKRGRTKIPGGGSDGEQKKLNWYTVYSHRLLKLAPNEGGWGV